MFFRIVERTDLITISPRVVLGADVLVGVFHTLFQRGHVLPVLPMLVPEVVSIKATTDQAGNDGTGIMY
jgi:hypothetical protein